MLTALIRAVRGSRHPSRVTVVVVAVALMVVVAHAAPEGSHHAQMAMDMSGGAAMCLAVLGGAIGTAVALLLTVFAPRPAPPRMIRAAGLWAFPPSGIDPVPRGPTLLQVFRL